MIDQNGIESCDKFFKRFTSSCVRVLYGALDRDVCKKIELLVDSYAEITSLDEFKKDVSLYKVDYTKSEENSCMILAIPNPLIVYVADVLMGGNGDKKYSGSLSELEVNSFQDLLGKVFIETKTVFNKICEHQLEFVGEQHLVTHEDSDFKTTLDGITNNFMVTYTLKINDTVEFSPKLLVEQRSLSTTMTRLGFFNDEPEVKARIYDALNMDLLSNIELEMMAELGRTKIPMKQALELTNGSIIELDSTENDDISVFVKGIEVAKAQIVVVEETLGLRLTKLVPPDERRKYLS